MFGPDLTVIGEVNGLPIALHSRRLLVGKDDFGPVADGETVEFTLSGIIVAGTYVGKIPEP
jgi:hypothetical protein